jgi:hypothetical protein
MADGPSALIQMVKPLPVARVITKWSDSGMFPLDSVSRFCRGTPVGYGLSVLAPMVKLLPAEATIASSDYRISTGEDVSMN